MELNITVFIQVIHFVVAYVVLERLFFRPAFFAVQERESLLKELQNTLATQTEYFMLTKNEAEESRLLHQKKLVQSAPSLLATPQAVECASVDNKIIQQEHKQPETSKVLSLSREQELINICKRQLLAKILS